MAIEVTGTISKDSPRRAAWLEVFGADRIPLLGPLPHRGRGPDGVEHEFYKADMKRVTPEQRGRLVRYLSEKFHLSEYEINRDLDVVGLPVMAEDVIVPIDMRFLT